QRRFGGDPGAVGKTIVLNGEPYEIIGVAGPGLKIEIEEPPDVYVPFQIDPNSTVQGQFFNAGGRLMPGVSVDAANAHFKIATEAYGRMYRGPYGYAQRFG